MVKHLILWFSPKSVMFSLFQHLIWFLTTFLFLLTWKSQQTMAELYPQTITYGKLKAINIEAFKAVIENSELIKYPKPDATQLPQQYGSVLDTLIDFHAPLVTEKISPSLKTYGWLQTSLLLIDIVDIWSASGVDIQLHSIGHDLLGRHTFAIDRCQRQNHLTTLKLLVFIDHYGRLLTKSYTVALKFTFLVIPLLTH